jgi:carboxypeptidase family protein/TonB-dependent receptor-like protein
MMPMLLALAMLQPPAAIHGIVHDQTGLPMAHVLVYVDATQMSTETDAAGRFELAIDPAQAVTISAFSEGFSPASAAIAAEAQRTGDPIVFVLTPAPFVEAVDVKASSARSPASSDFAMRPLDVVRTPGAQADLMRAVQMLPGVTQADEGAGLYVRGGDTSEVLVLLDDAIVFHPYRQETPGGGLYGSVEPFLLEGLSFSTGGFSAKYGNALSAVLDLHGLPRPDTPQANVTVGLAGASMRAAVPIGDRGGVRVSGNRSFPSLLFALNGEPYAFNPLPGGWDLNASAHYKSPAAGTFKVFAMATGDHVGVQIESLSFAGLLTSTTSSASTSVHWEKLLDGRWQTKATIGFTEYTHGTGVGVLNLRTTDSRASWRATTERAIGVWTLRAGVDGIEARTQVDGRVPTRGGDLGGVSGTETIRQRDGDRAAGAFLETERRWGQLAARVGVRADRFDLARSTTIDPRALMTFDLPRAQRVSLAWGIYHQAPEAAYFSYTGPAGLDAMRAQHLIAGYELGRETEAAYLRLEAYRKNYDALPFESSPRIFTSSGYGSAHGVDFFARTKRAPFDLTAMYSYLDAARRWTPFEDRDKYSTIPDGAWAPSFAMPHTARVVARVDLARAWQVSGGWRISSGRLDTPVTGATPTFSGFVPTYGPINSERLPRYERLDLTLNYLTRIAGSKTAVLFAAVGNVFARPNFFEYAYSSDFSTRRPITSATPRVVYFGLTFTR